jgi:hypothetical protein
MSDLTECESLAEKILEAYDSQPVGSDEWLRPEWCLGIGERLQVRRSTRPGAAGICRLHADVLGRVHWVDVPFDWRLLRERRGVALLATINEAQARLREQGS